MARQSKPWYRAARDGWFVTINGATVNLGVKGKDNEQKAWEAYSKRLCAPTVKPGCIRNLTQSFLDSCRLRGIQGKTVRDYGFALNWLVAVFGNTAVADLDPAAIMAEAARKPWSDSHKSNVLTTVQAFVRWAGRGEFALKRPAKESRGAWAVISETAWATVLRETRGDFHQLLRVLWETGARPCEVASLTVDAVDWPSGTATLKLHKMAHKGRTRILFFSDAAMEILRAQFERHKSGLLFRSVRGDQFNAHSIGVRMQRLRDATGLRLTAYDIRHTWATRALSQGHPDTHVANVMGHSDTRMIHRHYSHVCQDARLMRSIVNSVR